MMKPIDKSELYQLTYDYVAKNATLIAAFHERERKSRKRTGVVKINYTDSDTQYLLYEDTTNLLGLETAQRNEVKRIDPTKSFAVYLVKDGKYCFLSIRLTPGLTCAGCLDMHPEIAQSGGAWAVFVPSS